MSWNVARAILRSTRSRVWRSSRRFRVRYVPDGGGSCDADGGALDSVAPWRMRHTVRTDAKVWAAACVFIYLIYLYIHIICVCIASYVYMSNS